jgi:hypothetical protein
MDPSRRERTKAGDNSGRVAAQFQFPLWLAFSISRAPAYLITSRVARRFGGGGLAMCALPPRRESRRFWPSPTITRRIPATWYAMGRLTARRLWWDTDRRRGPARFTDRRQSIGGHHVRVEVDQALAGNRRRQAPHAMRGVDRLSLGLVCMAGDAPGGIGARRPAEPGAFFLERKSTKPAPLV